jgi:hypothetical protein
VVLLLLLTKEYEKRDEVDPKDVVVDLHNKKDEIEFDL